MRFLGIGETNDLAAMYLSLAERGHEVKVFIEDEACQDVFGGMLTTTPDWTAELGWVRDAGNDGIVLFESANKGLVQDALRGDGYNVIGGSALGDRLEADRSFGQDVLHHAGLPIAPTHRFTAYADGIAFLEQNQRRYVLKFNGANSPRTRNYIGQSPDGRDVAALLKAYLQYGDAPPQNIPETEADAVDFVLMEHLEGVEVGVGAYFNGYAFMQPVCVDFEHKRFFPGDLGELTGEMGTIVTYRGGQRLFEAALAPLAPLLRDGGYCGYINVNLIANEEGLWPLEFTSRFGYPGFAICAALHTDPWDTIFSRMLRRERLDFDTRGGFACGMVLTVPPFPYRHGYAQLSKGMPIFLDPQMTEEDRALIAFSEVARTHGQLVASGASGYLGVATGLGPTVSAANHAALALARKILVPNLRYRMDIGDRLVSGELSRLHKLGWFSAPPFTS